LYRIAERVTGPGFLLGRRYEENSGSPRFFGFSLTETREVLASVAYLAPAQRPTPLAQRAMARAFRNMTRPGDRTRTGSRAA